MSHANNIKNKDKSSIGDTAALPHLPGKPTGEIGMTIQTSESIELPAGYLVSGRYRLECSLGDGQMGGVYRARDEVLDSVVALKVLHPHHSRNPDMQKRFLQEVKLMHLVNHANVVRTYDVGQNEDLLYYTMEFVQGTPLDILLAQEHPIHLPRMLNMVVQICRGLHAIHQCEIVHRDLKPANIMVVDQQVIKITDFGVARPTNSALTQHGGIFGTMLYIAPEIILGDPVTFAADYYSLGIIIYEMLVGHVPFRSDQFPALMQMHVQRQPDPPLTKRPDIPPWLNQIVLKLLAKKPQERPSASIVADYIEEQTGTPKPGALEGSQGGAARAPARAAPAPTPGEAALAMLSGCYTPRSKRRRGRSPNRRHIRITIITIVAMWVVLCVVGALVTGVDQAFESLTRFLTGLR
jgi:eukaryotic-like serine/threonine-protein kinase